MRDRRATRSEVSPDPRDPTGWAPARVRRFWRKVATAGPDDCWPWLGRIGGKGIGRFAVRLPSGGSLDIYAPRAAWILTHGSVPGDREVFHLCERLSCVNPRHLRVGQPADRLEQTKARGRVPAGADHHAAKLTPGQVRRLRRLKADRPALRAKDVAPRYGISPTRLQAIWRGEGWALE